MNQLSLDVSGFAYRVTVAAENFLNRLADARKANNVMKSTIRELNALTDRELLDIGITRGEIEDIAKQQAKLI